jgi:hypothetical protein
VGISVLLSWALAAVVFLVIINCQLSLSLCVALVDKIDDNNNALPGYI